MYLAIGQINFGKIYLNCPRAIRKCKCLTCFVLKLDEKLYKAEVLKATQIYREETEFHTPIGSVLEELNEL